MEQKIKNLEKLIIQKQTELSMLKDNLNKVNENILDLNKKQELYTQVINFLMLFSDNLRDKISKKIECLVTDVLHDIGQTDRDFKIIYSVKRGVVEADFVLYDRINKENIDILESSGGGLADIVSTILLFIFLKINSPESDYIIFDEVGKHISKDKRNKFFELLSTLSKKYGIQIIYASHQEELKQYAQNIIELRKNEQGFVEVINNEN